MARLHGAGQEKVAGRIAARALTDLLPRAFTGDPAVIERANEVWPLFALMQPVNGAVFALDGILIGPATHAF